MEQLDGEKIAFLQTDGIEQVELVEPLEAIRDEGAEVTLVSLEEGEFRAFDHLDKADTFTADLAVSDADAGDLDEGLVTSRKPGDLPAFIEKAIQELCEGEHEDQARSVETAAR